MIGTFECAISIFVIFIVVFVWIIIILRRGYVITGGTLSMLEKYKIEASTLNEKGEYEVDIEKLAILISEGIRNGQFKP